MTIPLGTRILMTTDAVGGVWTFSVALARALGGRGAKVLLVNMGPQPSTQQRAMLQGAERVVLLETDLELEWRDPEGASIPRARSVLGRAERQFGPDLLHINGFREAAFGWHLPTVVVAHSCVNSWAEACDDAASFEGNSWATYSANVAAGLASASTWVAPTATFRDWIARRYDVERGHAIWNGVDRVAISDAAKMPVVLAAGRIWDRAKNLAVLSDVAAGFDWPIRVAGAAEIDATRTRASIAHCDVLGALSPPDLAREMQRAAIYVSPALYEPFGLSVLEAARAGCALVLSDLPGFRELWQGAALFVNPREPAHIRHALQALRSNPPLLKRMQQAALRRAGRYALHTTVDEYCALYGALLSRSEPRATLDARMQA